jgi:6-phosphogluconate dehydrogenase (decarboxylating)
MTSQQQADIGLIGLAVMGENLVLNMANHGHAVAVFNRTVAKVDEFVSGRAKGKSIVGARTLEELVALLKKPRRVMMMVKAGPAVDQLIAQLLPLLEPGDILIDGGNSWFQDTQRRVREVEARGLLYIGTGVSGGEEGALLGPSIMPGGSAAAWPHVQPLLQDIAAKVDGAPCCDWVGPDGAGHFVKMVHNGIEYGDMQLICEAYDLLKRGLGMGAQEMHDVFAIWNQGELDSYLIEITAKVLTRTDAETGKPLVDKILDTAGAEGHGQVDQQHRAGPGRAGDADHGGRVRALHVGAQGGARRGVPEAAGPQEPPTRATAASSSSRSGRRSTPPRSAPTRRASPCMRPRRRRTSGTSTTASSPCCGAAAASSAPASCRRSRRPTRAGARPREPAARPLLQEDRDQGAGQPGARSSSRRPSWAFRCRASGPRWPTTTATARPVAGQPAAGPARLLRRAHLRAGGQAARAVLPHRVAGLIVQTPSNPDLSL